MSETFHCETTGEAANQMRLRRNISENLFIFVDGPAHLDTDLLCQFVNVQTMLMVGSMLLFV